MPNADDADRPLDPSPPPDETLSPDLAATRAPATARSRASRELDPTLDPSSDPRASTPSAAGPRASDARTGSAARADARARARAEPGFAPGAVIANRFEVVRALGAGGMGDVYLVLNREIRDQQLALKVIRRRYSANAAFRERFLSEIRTAQSFVHENVCQVREAGQSDDGELYFAMDYIEGESLRECLAREQRLAPQHALEIARQLLAGLASGHKHGLVHADVKPANVMLAARVARNASNPFGVGVRLLDFGIAASATSPEPRAFSGSPRYMSPEQAKGERLDARSDVFAVAVTLYEMLAGARPFEARDTAELVEAVLRTDVRARVAALHEVDARVQAVLLRALEKDRESRYASADAFAAALAQAAAPRRVTRVPTWAKAAGLVLCGALLAAILRAAQLGEDVVLGAGLDELHASNRALRGDLDAARVKAGSYEVQAEQLRAERDDARETQRKLETELLSATSARDDLQRQRDVDAAALLERDRKLEAATRREYEKQARIDDYLHELTRLQTSAKDPIAYVRAELAAILDRVELSSIEHARKRFSGLEESDPVVQHGLRADLEVIELLLRAREALDSVAPRGYAERKLALERARECETAARRALAELASAPPPWALAPPAEAPTLAHAASAPSGAAPARTALASVPAAANAHAASDAAPDAAARPVLERVRAALDATSTRIVARNDELERDQSARWTELCADLVAANPRDVLAVALDFHDGRELATLERYVAAASRALAPSAALDLVALRSAEHVARWQAAVDALPALAASKPAAELRALACARRWYDLDPDDDPTPAELASFAGADAHAWRSVLELCVRIASPESAFPLAQDLSAVYVLTSDGEPPVYEHTRCRTHGGDAARGDASWSYERRRYSSFGVPLQEVESDRRIVITRAGSRFTQDSSHSILFDAKSTQRVEVHRFEPSADAALPAQVGVTTAQLDVFRAALARADRTCIVVDDGERRVWISPTLGLVREEGPGSRSLELLYANLP